MLARRAWRLSIASLVAAYSPTLRTPACSSNFLRRGFTASRICMAVEPPPEAPVEVEIVDEEPLRLPSNDDSDTLLRIRHTSAHVMAMAVQKLFKDARVTIGPWIEKGFYYDFDCETPFEDKDLRKIKKEMDKIIQRKYPLNREEVTVEEAKRRIEEINEPYKFAHTRLRTYPPCCTDGCTPPHLPCSALYSALCSALCSLSSPCGKARVRTCSCPSPATRPPPSGWRSSSPSSLVTRRR